jgi:hypothetical protein
MSVSYETEMRAEFETWFNARYYTIDPIGKETAFQSYAAGYARGMARMQEMAAAKVESMANFTGYYASLPNDVLINAADVIRELEAAPGAEEEKSHE